MPKGTTGSDVRIVAILHLKRLQRAGRAYVVRRLLCETRRSRACSRISHWFFTRPTIAWRYHRLLIAVIRAAIKIQKVWRGGRVRQALVDEMADHAFSGAMLLQRSVDAEIYQGAFQAMVGADLVAQREKSRQAAIQKDPTGARDYGLIAIHGCPPHVRLLQGCASGFQCRRLLGQIRVERNARPESTPISQFEDETLNHRRLQCAQRNGFRLSFTAFLHTTKKHSQVPRDYSSSVYMSEEERKERLEVIEESTRKKYLARMEEWVYTARQRSMDQRLSTATSFLIFLNRCALTIQRWYRHMMRNRHIYPPALFVYSNDEIYEVATRIVERRSVVALRSLQHKQLLSAWSRVTEVRRAQRPLVSYGAKWERKRQVEAAEYASTLPVGCARGIWDIRPVGQLGRDAISDYQPMAKPTPIITKTSRQPTPLSITMLSAANGPKSLSQPRSISPTRSNQSTRQAATKKQLNYLGQPMSPSRRGIVNEKKDLGAYTHSLVLPPIQHSAGSSVVVVEGSAATPSSSATRRTLAPIGQGVIPNKGPAAKRAGGGVKEGANGSAPSITHSKKEASPESIAKADEPEPEPVTKSESVVSTESVTKSETVAELDTKSEAEHKTEANVVPMTKSETEVPTDMSESPKVPPLPPRYQPPPSGDKSSVDSFSLAKSQQNPETSSVGAAAQSKMSVEPEFTLGDTSYEEDDDFEL